MRKIACVGIAVVLFMVFGGFGSRIQTVDSMPIHEGFATPVRDIPPLQAAPSKPPAPINEVVPPQTDSATIWIPGYWAYSDELSNFVWVTGAWRRPPPDHQWISGRWQEFESGWVWVSGFWSDKSESQLNFVEQRPPDSLDDEVASASDSENSTWAQGYWSWIADSSQFEWVQGTWMNYDPNWMFVPAHWTWRPEGYVFIDSYWDWPIDMRGSAYSPVYIEPSDFETVAYEPSSVLDSSYVFDSLLPYYPDYGYLYSNDFCRRRKFWQDSDLCPPWWGWGNWWGASWSNQWGLWWWWSHPGFVQPGFVNDSLGSIIVPPSKRLVQKCSGIQRPTIVTNNGVVSPNTALRAGRKAWGAGSRRDPIFPSHFSSAKNQELLQQSLPRTQKNTILPTGKKREKGSSTQGPTPAFSDFPRGKNFRQRPQNEPIKPHKGTPRPSAQAPKAAPKVPPVRQPPAQKPPNAPSAQAPRQAPKSSGSHVQKVPRVPSTQAPRSAPKSSSQKPPKAPSAQAPRQAPKSSVSHAQKVPRVPSTQALRSAPKSSVSHAQKVPRAPSTQAPRSAPKAPQAQRQPSQRSVSHAQRAPSPQTPRSAPRAPQVQRQPAQRSVSHAQRAPSAQAPRSAPRAPQAQRQPAQRSAAPAQKAPKAPRSQALLED